MNFGILLFAMIVVAIAILIILGKWHNKITTMLEPEEEEKETPEEYLNSKLPVEGDSVIVTYNKYTIQLSPSEYVIWTTWDRERKRTFIRDYIKLKEKGLLKK